MYEDLESHIPGLRRFARVLMRGHVEGADDLVQDCLVRALSHWQVRSGEHLQSWPYTILYNRFRTDLRNSKRSNLIYPYEAIPEKQQPCINGEQEASLVYRDLIRGFGLLPENHRTVLF